MNKLFIIEGIPGSGKTTFARMLGDKLTELNHEVHLYVEGDLHPADMAWCACLTQEEYDTVCNQYPEHREDFERNITKWKDYVILAYIKVPSISEELFSYFESKELYDGRVNMELFCGIHQSRWEKFGKEATGIQIFECALLQNAVNELLLFRGAEEETITNYIIKLIETVKNLNPVILYLDVDVNTAIERAVRERVDGDGNRVWENRVAEYVENSLYGKKNGLKGVEGMYRYYRERKQLERKILEKLPVIKYTIPILVEHQPDITNEFIQKLCYDITGNTQDV
ncbi:P-loop NTPase family protein [Lachnoclostridium phytofermentans]|uniref:Thymidylate kinase n=1 Tax=Lachnoclostridium phytofermentans (strain ATCC 700394 / DSM 18823 / ISDg) TaxID=357809 RepID=A9KK10_LACP7|nr:hypothetical protein [Lachnoclostridium phytofermentans]ABX42582.1 conserved hypothetical protein [Lachnoclostridium phytofermentans ISDg]